MGHGTTAIFGRFTGHRDDLGKLFRAEAPRRTRAGGIIQHRFDPGQQSLIRIAGRFGRIECLGPVSPALPPRPYGGAVEAELMGNRLIRVVPE